MACHTPLDPGLSTSFGGSPGPTSFHCPSYSVLAQSPIHVPREAPQDVVPSDQYQSPLLSSLALQRESSGSITKSLRFGIALAVKEQSPAAAIAVEPAANSAKLPLLYLAEVDLVVV